MTDLRKPIVVTEENFPETVLKAEKPVLLYFWMETCGPCKTVSPKVDKLAQEYGDRVNVCKSNVHDWPGGAEHYNVVGVPRILMICKGEIKQHLVGNGYPLEQIKTLLDEVIAPCATTAAPPSELAQKAKAELDAAIAAASDQLEKEKQQAWAAIGDPHKDLYEAATAARKPITDEVNRRLADVTAKRDKGEITQDDWIKALIEKMREVEAEPQFKDAAEQSGAAYAKLFEAMKPYNDQFEASVAKAEAGYDEKVAQAKAKYAATVQA
jgi:thioredoxin 1